MSVLVLDTGTLVALERGTARLRAFLQAASVRKAQLRVPASTLTEFLGHSPKQRRRQADYVASHLRIDPIDEALARRAGALTRRALDRGPKARPGAIDALGVAHAEALEGIFIFEGDRADFEALADASGSVEIVDLADLV